MCSGRVDLSFVLRAFRNGMDGVFIGGCHFNECHYITDGNYHALSLVLLCQKLMAHMGLNPERLRLEELSAGEGIRFAEVMNEFAVSLQRLGPLGVGEGLQAGAGQAALTVKDAEKQLIIQALEATGGNRTLAAQRIGMSRRTLHRKLHAFHLEDF